jgi:hypothetical protein
VSNRLVTKAAQPEILLQCSKELGVSRYRSGFFYSEKRLLTGSEAREHHTSRNFCQTDRGFCGFER